MSVRQGLVLDGVSSRARTDLMEKSKKRRGRAVPASNNSPSGSVVVRLVVKPFYTPPIHDALVLGKRSAIGCVAMRRALSLLQTSTFDHIEFEDDVISDILARESIVRIVGREALIRLVVQRVKPLMADTDILHMDIDAQLHLEAEV